MNRYDWSKLSEGYYIEGDELIWVPDPMRWDVRDLERAELDETHGAKAQLTKCRIRDTDRAPVPEQAPPVMVRTEAFDGWLVGRSTSDLTVSPSQPWRRGPLAAWTLVNISCHDGRLTVVMKRGRGELVMETGPDDEVLWERLAQKAESYTT